MSGKSRWRRSGALVGEAVKGHGRGRGVGGRASPCAEIRGVRVILETARAAAASGNCAAMPLVFALAAHEIARAGAAIGADARRGRRTCGVSALEAAREAVQSLERGLGGACTGAQPFVASRTSHRRRR